MARSPSQSPALWFILGVVCVLGIGVAFWIGLQWGQNGRNSRSNQSLDHPRSADQPTAKPEAVAVQPRPKSVDSYDYSRLVLMKTLEGPKDTINSIAFSPDGRYLAAAGGVS
jgi:WD40 repeat protein